MDKKIIHIISELDHVHVDCQLFIPVVDYGSVSSLLEPIKRVGKKYLCDVTSISTGVMGSFVDDESKKNTKIIIIRFSSCESMASELADYLWDDIKHKFKCNGEPAFGRI